MARFPWSSVVWRSVEVAADLLNKARRFLAQRLSFGERQDVLERKDGGAQVVEVAVKDAGFPPNLGAARGQKQHTLHHRKRLFGLLLFQEAETQNNRQYIYLNQVTLL